MDEQAFRTIASSRIAITELMIPSYANFGGKIHGGILLSLMDKAAYACASKHAGGYRVTVSVDGVDFLAPVDVGELVSMDASIHYVGRTSMLVGIVVTAEDVITGVRKHTNTSYFTMVAKGADDKPCPVPGLILETTEEVRLFREGMRRRALKLRYKEDLRELHAQIESEPCSEGLAGERCEVRLT
jgi:acyl-CoA hydrolase